MSVDGRISQYIEVLPNDTSQAAAKAAALENLPSDVRTVSFIVTASCAFWNLTSHDLKITTGSSGVAVELAYDDPSGSPYWLPDNVNTLTFNTGQAESSDVC
jgi:hypothetical protein